MCAMDRPAADSTSYKVFAHLNAEKADVYRAIMVVFTAAKTRFALHLRTAEVVEALNRDANRVFNLEEIEVALLQLCEWGNLEAHPDTAEVATVEEFLRPRHLFRATSEGEAAEAALSTYVDALTKPGELQTTALADIRDFLGELFQLARTPDPDAAKVHQVLTGLCGRFEELTNRAQTFMSSLQRTIDLHGVEVATFLAYKETLIDYLQRFIGDLITATADIIAKLKRIESLDVQRLLRVAAGRELIDSVNVTSEQRESIFQLWLTRWTGLTSWFVRGEQGASQAEVLRISAVAAITALLSAAAEINDRRFRRSDRAADLRILARWFAQTGDDRQAHRLWRAAFALAPARHLHVDQSTLDDREEHTVPAQTSWLDAPPLRISPRLRAYGRHTARGPTKVIIDRSREKALLAAEAEAEEALLSEARRRLITTGTIRLSEIGGLQRASFDLFLDLLGEALAGKAIATDQVEATSTDGSLTVRLTPTGDQRLAVIETDDGIFSGPDHFIEISESFSEGLDQNAPNPISGDADLAPDGQVAIDDGGALLFRPPEKAPA